MNKGLNLLGLAQRAGKLVSGEETVIKNIRQGQAQLVIVCVDASDNTKKKLKDKCTFYHVPYVEAFTNMELSHAIGKKRTVCGLTEAGFKQSLLKILQG
ncbi:L7Ae/L30e/S12e/Gadd45 family ribosomal protein [Enterococcus nangangensis]|uniref:L7Ae/L30e/S12e/Gadd45 family ribosomal protein n=1 Tax=Enterococcus nangangensis TaxID=2559926 RepID=UPI0010FA40B3|nr:ribosomal L7Ae/L30e/S12e/Gadd45 family protein [Enterococcus nangangensis]